MLAEIFIFRRNKFRSMILLQLKYLILIYMQTVIRLETNNANPMYGKKFFKNI